MNPKDLKFIFYHAAGGAPIFSKGRVSKPRSFRQLCTCWGDQVRGSATVTLVWAPKNKNELAAEWPITAAHVSQSDETLIGSSGRALRVQFSISR